MANRRTINANLTRMRAADEKLADRLRARGWTCVPPADYGEELLDSGDVDDAQGDVDDERAERLRQAALQYLEPRQDT